MNKRYSAVDDPVQGVEHMYDAYYAGTLERV